jgi:two-component system KDP operon response regulator KdpE
MQGTRILVIEDDVHIRRMIRDLLTRAGSQVSSASDGPRGLQTLFSERPDLVILDVNMRGSDGWHTFQQMRVMTETPVIVLATSSEEGASARAFSLGAADFIGKPFKARSLLERTKNVLKQNSLRQREPKRAGYEDSYLSVDPDTDRVMVRGERVALTKTELRILKYLVANGSALVTFEEILKEVWGPGYEDSLDYVHVYISRLRHKIEERPRQPKYIVSEHGLGYRFDVSS